MNQRRPHIVPAAVISVAAVVWLSRSRRARRAARALRSRAQRRLRRVPGWMEGLQYRRSGCTPDPNATGTLLADRVRSTLGPLEKRLDIPRVHVMADDHVILLHGAVPTERDEREIVDAVLAMPGVTGVVSYLHSGLLPGDSRPSTASTAEPSVALQHLIETAAGAGAINPRRAARAVLGVLADRLPEGERNHLLSHLPADVRALARLPLHYGRAIRDIREFVTAVGKTGALIEASHPTRVIEAVVAEIRSLVPEEVDDVAAVLPQDLRELWLTAVRTRG